MTHRGKPLPVPSPELAAFLDRKAEEFNSPAFIERDPISVPHSFSLQQDIEISGLFAAVFSWGNRTTIINKSNELMALMDRAPYQFIRSHEEKDLKKMLSFKHRTFNTTDLLYFISFLKYHYTHFHSLEDAFLPFHYTSDMPMEKCLLHFHHRFFSMDEVPPRTAKHIPSPQRGSTCKRLNMYLRWMVRRDNRGVDFGLWKKLQPKNLICPIDLHVARISKKLGLIADQPLNWKLALALTDQLKKLDPLDPVKYDFALFGLGINKHF